MIGFRKDTEIIVEYRHFNDDSFQLLEGRVRNCRISKSLSEPSRCALSIASKQQIDSILSPSTEIKLSASERDFVGSIPVFRGFIPSFFKPFRKTPTASIYEIELVDFIHKLGLENASYKLNPVDFKSINCCSAISMIVDSLDYINSAVPERLELKFLIKPSKLLSVKLEGTKLDVLNTIVKMMLDDTKPEEVLNFHYFQGLEKDKVFLFVTKEQEYEVIRKRAQLEITKENITRFAIEARKEFYNSVIAEAKGIRAFYEEKLSTTNYGTRQLKMKLEKGYWDELYTACYSTVSKKKKPIKSIDVTLGTPIYFELLTPIKVNFREIGFEDYFQILEEEIVFSSIGRSYTRIVMSEKYETVYDYL